MSLPIAMSIVFLGYFLGQMMLQRSLTRFYKIPALARRDPPASLAVYISCFVLGPVLAWRFGIVFALLPGVRLTGLALTIAGLGLSVWAQLALGRNYSGSNALHDRHQLVTSGPYRVIRQPMYTGFLVSATGIGLLTLCLGFFVFTASLPLACLCRIRDEERVLLAAFGDEYARYKAATRRFIPRC